MARTSVATTAPGALIGDYRIERLIGEGGMGTVYSAVHSVIDKRVALKVLRRELCAKPSFVSRFVKEARATNRIGHPNIVDVFGFGLTHDGRAYLAMELLDGQSLCTRIRAGGLSVDEASGIAIEISHALEAAHGAEIVHRDLKPENVFLANIHGRSVVKLLDFGIAKLNDIDSPANFTQPGTMMGTPMYVAPEQARGDVVDGRADIYALGVMLFEMFVGRPPFLADNALELIACHIAEEPPIPSSLDPRLPPSADRLLASLLAKEPARRPTLAEVRAGLEEIRIESGLGQSGISTHKRLQSRAATIDPGTTAEWLASVQPRRPLTMILFGLLALTIGFTLVVKLLPYFVER